MPEPPADADGGAGDTDGLPPPVPAPRPVPFGDGPPARVGRFRVEGEVGRGAMGLVLRAHDPDLDRPVAVKVMRAPAVSIDFADLEKRFLREARVGGRLQHPGLVPVFEVGRADGDRRPFFAMKLVQGRTLAALLAGRPSPADDLPRFLLIFEQVCQAVDYAHSRGVVHRDLKPANVMVGEFGEVQVMDWGLAKVLAGQGRQPPEEPTPAAEGAGEGSGASLPGSVLGTPAYMAPEQARGHIDRVDARSDVFGLGGVLSEVLTGRPPYAAKESWEVLQTAQRADLAAAFARLDGCGADPELVRLAKACLDPDPERRPADGGAVAEAVAAHRAGVEGRLRAAELAKAAAQAKAAAERKRRRAVTAAAALAVAAVAAGGAAWWWVGEERPRWRGRRKKTYRMRKASGGRGSGPRPGRRWTTPTASWPAATRRSAAGRGGCAPTWRQPGASTTSAGTSA
jgi:serine/threonine-protein kinase